MPSHASTAAKVRAQKEANRPRQGGNAMPRRQTAEEKLLTAVLGPKEAAKLLNAPPTYAYAYRSGHIGFGPNVPEGALPIGKLGRKLKRSTIEACARLSRADNKTMFVPGVPEAESDNAALEAFEKVARMGHGGEVMSRDIPILTPITARPVDLNPAAWGEEDDAPACYVRGCGAIEDLEPCFIGQWVCPDCKASYQHQEALRQEFGAEGREG